MRFYIVFYVVFSATNPEHLFLEHFKAVLLQFVNFSECHRSLFELFLDLVFNRLIIECIQ